MNTAANEAAALIAEFDVATAAAFRAQPFNRALIAQAFRGGFARHSNYSAKVCDFVDCAVKLDQLDRVAA
jgi:hypothetical protein